MASRLVMRRPSASVASARGQGQQTQIEVDVLDPQPRLTNDTAPVPRQFGTGSGLHAVAVDVRQQFGWGWAEHRDPVVEQFRPGDCAERAAVELPVSPCQMRGVDVQDLVLGNVHAVQLCRGGVFARDLVEHAEVLATLGVETGCDDGHEIQVTDAGLEAAGSERPNRIEPNDVSDRMHGFGEGHHFGRLVEAEIHRISMPHCRRPARDPRLRYKRA